MAFLYKVNCLIAGLLLLFGVFRNEQSLIFNQIVVSLFGLHLLFTNIVILPIIETVIQGENVISIEHTIVAIPSIFVCFVPQVYLILCSVNLHRKLTNE